MHRQKNAIQEPIHQDWTTYVVNKPQKKGPLTKDRDISNAIQGGHIVEAKKKFFGGQNKIPKQFVPNPSTLEEDDGDYHIETVSFSFAQSLQKARMTANLTQAKLAQMINEKASVINEYETGRAIPNGQVINKLNKVLNTRLPVARESKHKT